MIKKIMSLNLDIPQIQLVLGGAASGKSHFAENLVIQTGRPRRYIATAEAWDDEMKTKIAAHKVQRGPDWITCEEPLDMISAIEASEPNEIILLDCVTMWLTNLMLAKLNIDQQSKAFINTLKKSPCPIILVSNEVGHGIVPDNPMSRKFVKYQGAINQSLADVAAQVFFITAGIPQCLKRPT
ncbi:MAG: bifunctional adenosylcobinamide kinase/adenosylcobinamide-phosphate guanylyltransferase [Planktomarina sp.]|nr:bifunctional adenosylcobinamide kinase/adenosylcobinamide-phosphate guanylyltransferase [Planktomarina sp.]